MFHSQHRRARSWGSLVILGTLLLVSGCGQGRKTVYPVYGKVLTAGEKPAEGALVVFHPLGAATTESTKPLAYVKNDGSFALTTYTQADGAPEGEYAITIEWRPPTSNPFGRNKEGVDQLQG